MNDNDKTVAQTLQSASAALKKAAYAIKGREHTGFIANAISEINAALASMPQAAQPVAIPDGWRLTPIQPTPEMLAAGLEHTKLTTDEDEDPKLYRAKGQAAAVYYFMLDAAPVPPAPSAEAIRNAALPKGYSAKQVEGHGWVVNTPQAGSWIAHEGTPIAALLADLVQSPPVSKEPLQTAPSADKDGVA